MNKLALFMLLALPLLVSGAACFEPVGAISSNNVVMDFKIAQDGKFYVLFTTNNLVASQDGATWSVYPFSAGFAPTALAVHPDPQKSGTVLVAGYGQYMVSSNAGLTWNTINNGDPGDAGIMELVQWNGSSKEIIAVDLKNASVFKLNSSLLLEKITSTDVFAGSYLVKGLNVRDDILYFVAGAGASAYSIVKLISLNDFTRNSASIPMKSVRGFLAASDGKLYYGNSSIVAKHEFGQPLQYVSQLTNGAGGIVEYKNGLIFSSNATIRGNDSFAFYNGTDFKFFELNSTSATPDFSPLRVAVSPTDHKLYVLGYNSSAPVGQRYGLFRFMDSCIRVNTVPVVVASVVNATVLVNSGATLIANATDAEGDVLSFNWTQLSGSVVNMGLWNYSASNASVSIYFDQVGIYSFQVNVTDSGSPNMVGSAVVAFEVVEPAPVVLSCSDDLECSAAEYCSENNTCAAIPIALRCASSDACAPNQECLNARRCVELSCEASEVIVDHACLAPGQFTTCGGQSFTGVGSCCSEQWIVGALQCPVVTPPVNNGSLNGSNGTRPGGNVTGGDLFASISQAAGSLGAIGLVVAGVLVLALLLVIFLVVFRKKKPPVDELMASEPSQPEDTRTEEPEEPTEK